MDVLFNSINIRELLSSQDLDDSSPLSAPDLRLLIDRLQVHSLHIKSKVQDYILSHNREFSDLFSQCSDSISQSDRLSGQVSDLVKLISDHPIDTEIRDTVQQIGRHRVESKEKKELLELVRVILELSEKLRSVKEDSTAGRVVEAAETLRQLKAALRVQDNTADDSGEPLVYGLLRKEWNECFEEIQDVLVRFMEKAVRFEQQSNEVRVKYELALGETRLVELQTVLEAMDVIGIVDYGLAKVADLMIKYVIAPAVNSDSFILSVDKSIKDSGNIAEVVLRMVRSSNAENESIDGENIYSALTQVVKFIFDFLCFQNPSWMRSVGRLTWPRMSELVISNFLSKVVPDDASKLADFQKIREITSQFEIGLKEMMFISTSDGKNERLSNYADNVEVHFASRKKIEILTKARNLLLHSDFNLPKDYTRKNVGLKNEGTAETSGDNVVDLIFSSDRCVISGAASQLVELVHQTLKDICLSSSGVALEFYHAARDALLLYEAVIPIKLERQLDGINQVAVLIHNDCLYLSQEILGFAFEVHDRRMQRKSLQRELHAVTIKRALFCLCNDLVSRLLLYRQLHALALKTFVGRINDVVLIVTYRSDFPSSVKDAVFIDLGTRFQLMAEEILERQIRLVIHNLIEAIDGADGFQNTHQTKQFESAKFSIDQVVFILEKVRMIWEPLLLPLTYKRSMCVVVETVFCRMSKDILLLDDMAAEETLQLQRLIHLMLENLSSLLASLVAINQSRKSPDGLPRSIDDFIPSLQKIRRLADLLDMPLKSITTAWESGELVSCGFTSLEVEDFIRAIFTDSPLRRECLWRIENGSYDMRI